jgi:membrane protein DedA with SNARE-associated domain
VNVSEYVILFVLVAILGAGLPGPGDAALIAAGTLAGEGRLNVWIVLAVSMTAWMLGSVGGFEIGHYGGRSLLDHDGPLAKSRRKLLAKGDRVFGGHTFAASVTMPAFVSGIFRVRFGLFMLGALVAGIGWIGMYVGLSYFLGAEIARRIGEAGTKAIIGVIVIVCAGLLARAAVARWRARRSAKQGEPGQPDEPGEQAPVLVPPAMPVRQDGADHPQDREDEPDEAKHPVPLPEAEDREGEQQH